MTPSGDLAEPARPVPARPQEAASEAGQAPRPRPHVLLVCDRPSWEQVGPIIRRLVIGLIDEAVPVSLVCDRDCPAGADLPGVLAIHTLQPQGYFDLLNPGRRFEALLEYAQRTRPTCIHAVSVGCLETAVDIRRALNIPLLVTADTMDDPALALLADLLGADCLAAAMSERIRQALLACGGGRADRGGFAEVIAPGIYVQQRHQPPFEPGAPVSMLVLEPATRGRAFETILQATARLLEGGVNAMLFFIDSGPAETHLRKLAMRLQIHEHITFTGRFMRWPQTLGAADLVILPQPQRQVRIYPLEAMASGTLVVAAAGHCYDTIVDGRTGLEFDPDREGDLADKLARVLADPHQARSLAYSAQERIRRDHSVSRMVNAYIGLYGRLGRLRPAPAG